MSGDHDDRAAGANAAAPGPTPRSPKAPPLIVGYDDSPEARAALVWAANEARLRKTSLVVAFVLPAGWDWMLPTVQVNPDPIRLNLEIALSGSWTAPVRSRHVPYRTTILRGSPGPALLDLARQEGAACVVIGAKPHGRLHTALNGGVASYLRQCSRRPVIEVPAGAHQGFERGASSTAPVPRSKRRWARRVLTRV